jgi:predicted nucleotidyltransferase
MLTRKTAIQIIKDFIKACADRNITFNKVILFGSVANGDNRKYSDIDVAFVSDKFTDNPFENWHALSPIIIKDSRFTDIETHTFTTKDFEEGDPFIEEIKKTGIEIDLKKL